ncbi:hypothetical protein WS95_11445 [Burkholderia sp. MSMB1826]|nr:hypothetical protein WS95_11445 [Burkholderia sp. MSMB1826]KWE55156.1 hypothetical protein WT53_22360 [Burkholderia sp. MSMB2157WGS]
MTHAPALAGFVCNRTTVWRDTGRHRATRRFGARVVVIRWCAASYPVTAADPAVIGFPLRYRTRH